MIGRLHDPLPLGLGVFAESNWGWRGEVASQRGGGDGGLKRRATMVVEPGAVRMVAGGDEGTVITSGGSLLRVAVVVGCVEFRVYGLSWG
jgi:hypothetical protein